MQFTKSENLKIYQKQNPLQTFFLGCGQMYHLAAFQNNYFSCTFVNGCFRSFI